MDEEMASPGRHGLGWGPEPGLVGPLLRDHKRVVEAMIAEYGPIKAYMELRHWMGRIERRYADDSEFARVFRVRDNSRRKT